VIGDPPVWITGVGASTPLGNGYSTIAANLLAGRSGVSRIVEFPVDDQPSQIAGRVGGVPCPKGSEPGEFGRRRAIEQVVLWCCNEALRDSGWWDRRGSVRIGLILGIGAEWLATWENDSRVSGSATEGHPDRNDSLVDLVRRELGLNGPTLALSAACASGNHTIAQARRWLALGWADVCLAGAYDMSLAPLALACFGNLRTLSRKNDTPTIASRPFDRDRDGFVMSEGGCAFVVEPIATARRRSARVYAAVTGFGATSDAHHAVIPSPDPEPAALAVRTALKDAQVSPAALDYINAHAPGTPVGDVLEVKALRAALGEAVAQIPISSTKSMTGHLLTAAGAMECLACITALEHQALPPTINLDNPDPDCADLNHVALEARPANVETIASNSFGFGGSNTCLVLRRV
jgi:3-oxoacyl-[acyl-carrier-protein] synthase II